MIAEDDLVALTGILTTCANTLQSTVEMLRGRNEGAAADCAESIANLTQETLRIESSSINERAKNLLATANLHAMPHGNWLGEAVIWPAYRRAGMHRECDEWTEITNSLRSIRGVLLAKLKNDDVDVAPAASPKM